MFSQVLQDISKPSYLGIIGELKRSGGLAIPELAKLLDMSYMGVKQHCVNLESMGYIKAWRVPRAKVGRPQKLYQLTAKSDPLFPSGGVDLVLALLQGVKQNFGETAPEKLLYHYFENQRDLWVKTTKPGKSLVEKATRLADSRTQTGHFCHCHYSVDEGFFIDEYHHPLHAIFKIYPRLMMVETKMMEQALSTQVIREQRKGSHGIQCTVYRIRTLG